MVPEAFMEYWKAFITNYLLDILGYEVECEVSANEDYNSFTYTFWFINQPIQMTFSVSPYLREELTEQYIVEYIEGHLPFYIERAVVRKMNKLKRGKQENNG